MKKQQLILFAALFALAGSLYGQKWFWPQGFPKDAVRGTIHLRNGEDWGFVGDENFPFA